MPSRTSRHFDSTSTILKLLGRTCLTAMLMTPHLALADTLKEEDLFSLDLRALAQVKVVSVTKQEQNLSESAAAIHVVSAEDMRRAGITRLPEALRLVPGLMVHRINANQWAISARGFPSRFTRKLLTLVNGRSIYDPTFAGTYWPLQDFPIEEVARIEVILGPGATLWGANAVNGIINILTHDARNTHGNEVSVGIGNEDRLIAYAGHGGEQTFGDNATHYRVFASHKRLDGLVDTNGNSTRDDWHTERVGLRTDTNLKDGRELFVEADVLRMVANESTLVPGAPPPPANLTLQQPRKISNAYHLLGKLSDSDDDGNHWSLQAYYDYAELDTTVGTRTATWDIEYQRGFRLADVHHVIWGVGGRSLRNSIDPGTYSNWKELTDRLELFNAFVQDEIRLMDDRLRVTLGSKVEKSEYTGVEFQPNARFTWLGLENHVFWGAVSRALRTPSRANRDLRSLNIASLAGTNPANPFAPANVLVQLRGNEDVREVESEELTAWELGYRFNEAANFSMDIALFYNDYGNLNSLDIGTPEPLGGPNIIVPLLRDNNLEGEAVGGEIAMNWQAASWWRLRADYSHFHVNLRTEKPELVTPFSQVASDLYQQSPRHKVNLRSQMDLDNDVELDLWVRHVSDIPAQQINAYINMDARIGWKPNPDVELSLIGQNLLDDQQSESRQTFVTGPQADVERSFHVKASWSF